MTAVAEAVLRSLLYDGWIDNARNMGEYFKKRLLRLKDRHAAIKDVRGIGLIIGMELDREGAEIVNACTEKGFLINCTHEKVLRFVPPLIVRKKEINLLVKALDDVLGNL